MNVVYPPDQFKSIGIGSYLADYLSVGLATGGLRELASAAVYIAEEVRKCVDGVGPTDRLILFDCKGGYDEILGGILSR